MFFHLSSRIVILVAQHKILCQHAVVLLSDSYFYFFGTQNYSKVLNHKPFSFFFSNDKLVNRDIPKLQKLYAAQNASATFVELIHIFRKL